MANIKIADVDQRVQYTATSLQTVFIVPFPFLENSDLQVYQNSTLLTEGASPGQYAVAGAGNASGGTVTLVTGAPLNDIITITGILPIDRSTIYSTTISNLTGTSLNTEFNREIIMMKQLWTQQNLMQLQYAPYTLVSQDENVTIDRWLPLLGANQGWVKNAGNTAIEAYDLPAGGAAPKDAEYIIRVADADLPNAQVLGSLASGIVVNTTTSGVVLTRTLTGTLSQITITNGNGISGAPTFAIADNCVLPGTEAFMPPQGTTAQRPPFPVDGMVRYNTDTKALEVYESTAWDPLSGGVVDSVVGTANQIDVNNTDPANPILSISSTLDAPGTFTVQNTVDISAIINDPTMATASATNLSTSAAIKTYVDNVAAGFHFQQPVRAAMVGNFVNTYDNGTGGVGATMTATSNGAASADGVSLALNDRVLFSNQTTTYQNGIYYVSQVGDGSNPAIYTRSVDFDTPAEIQPGDLVSILEGTIYQYYMFLQTATVTTVGSDAVTFVVFLTDSSTAGTQFTVSQASHGLAVNEVVKLSGSNTYAKAQADSATNAEVAGVVAAVIDANTFILATGGLCSTFTGLTANSVYYLSDSVAGQLTTTEPTTVGSISKPVLNAATTTSAIINNMRGIEIGVAGSNLASVQVFTANGTWTKPSGVTQVIVECLGGGGAGGGPAATGAGEASAGAGGAGGGYGKILIDVSAISSETVTIGAAGTPASGAQGGAGGTSSFGAHISCTGGGGGTSMTTGSGDTGANGGAPGTSSGGDVNATANGGHYGLRVNAAPWRGHGGSSQYGGGGRGGYTSTTSTGFAATGYGAGGGGGANAASRSATTGAAGTAGLIIVWEYKF